MSAAAIRKEKRPNIRIRPLFVLWHRWFGILAALWLALMGLTGSAVVYYDELDVWLNQDLKKVEARSEPASVELWFAAARDQFPDRFIRFVDLPGAPDDSVRLSMPSLEDDSEVEVFVDPYTAELLGSRSYDAAGLGPRNLMNFLYGLHLDLHLGDWMLWFLGLVAFFWILDHAVSVVLSFPTARKWAASFRVRWRKGRHKLTFDLHRAMGLWLWPVTLMFAVSGLYFNWYEHVVAAVDRVSPVTERAIFALPANDAADFAPQIDFDEAFTIAGRLEGAPEVDLASYNPWKAAYELRAHDVRDIDPYGRRMIVVEANSGKVLSDRHITEGTAGDVFLAWQYPLHSGKAFGGIGRAIIFVSGILVAILCITGIILWARKLGARRWRKGARRLG